jgi:hypothetical protein
VTAASLLTLLLGAAVMAEVARASLPLVLLWQLGVAWASCSVALALREGRRWAFYATVLAAVVSPGLAVFGARSVGPAGIVPFLLAPIALGLLVPERSARWLRPRRRMVFEGIDTVLPGPAPTPAVLAVQSDYALAGAIAPGRLSR